MRLSNRDLVLLAGIIVAVVVTLTTLVFYRDQFSQKEKSISPKSTSLLHTTANRFLEFIGHRVEARKIH